MKTRLLRCWASLGRPLPAFFPIFCLLIFPCPLWAGDSPVITDIMLSPDSERLVIKTTGHAPEPETSVLRGPTRLAVDLKGARPGNGVRPLKNPSAFIREVRVGWSAVGARVEVEFTEDRVPDHRIRKLGSTLMVLFARPSPTVSEAAGGRLSHETSDLDERLRKWDAIPAATGGADFFVRKADVENGLITLEVQRRKEPNATYRITLGVDFARQGFSTASVRKIFKSVKSMDASQNAWSAPAGTARGGASKEARKPRSRKPGKAVQNHK